MRSEEIKLNLRQLLALSKVSFHELLREKILWSSFIFGLLAVALAFLVSRLSFADSARIALNFGLTSISIVGGLISVVMGSALIAKEIQNRTHFSVLTKPIWRWQFIVGRSLGLFGVLFLNAVLMATILLIVFLISDGVYDASIFKSLILQITEFFVLAATASVFSVFSTATLSAIMTSGIWVMGHAMEDLRVLSLKIEPLFMRPVLNFISQLLPNLNRFDVKANVAHGLPLTWDYTGMTLFYGIAYVGFAFVASCFIFSKREL